MTAMRELFKACGRVVALGALLLALVPAVTLAQQPEAAAPATEQAERAGGEVNVVLPDLGQTDVGGYNGRTLLMIGLVVSAAGILFGLVILNQLKNMPVHRSMREISELIYETCKTYLITQGRFLAILEFFIAAIIILYFGVLSGLGALRVGIILLFSVVGILGSYGVAWFGIRVNTYANSRTAFASLKGLPHPLYAIPLKAGMSIGMLLISVELLIMLFILLFIPGDYAGPCFIGFAIGESLGASVASHRRRHLHQDRRHRLRPDEDRVQHQGRRRPQPRRHRRLHRRQRRRLGGPERRRLRDLRRDRRGADPVHHAGGQRRVGPGQAAGVDLRDAHHDGGGQRRLLPDQRSDCEQPVCAPSRR